MNSFVSSLDSDERFDVKKNREVAKTGKGKVRSSSVIPIFDGDKSLKPEQVVALRKKMQKEYGHPPKIEFFYFKEDQINQRALYNSYLALGVDAEELEEFRVDESTFNVLMKEMG